MDSPIGTPPNAPTKPGVFFKEPLWKKVARTGMVRKKYLKYSPDDVEEIDSVTTLKRILKQYTVPPKKVTNIMEEFYLSLMASCITMKLKKM